MIEIDIIEIFKDFGIAGMAVYFMYRLADRAIAHAHRANGQKQ